MAGSKKGQFHGDQWFLEKVEARMRGTMKELQNGDIAMESLRSTEAYKAEFRRQAALFKAERRAQAEERLDRQRQDSRTAMMECEELAERDREWAAEHEADTDDELLDYLRQCAAELGHTPARREVLGSTYIGERFGNWAVALTVAGLRLPRNKRPKEEAVNAYFKRRKKAEKQG